MRYLLLLLAATITLSACTKGNDVELVTITGRAMASYNTTYANTALFTRIDDGQRNDPGPEFTSDANGNFSFTLPRPQRELTISVVVRNYPKADASFRLQANPPSVVSTGNLILKDY